MRNKIQMFKGKRKQILLPITYKYMIHILEDDDPFLTTSTWNTYEKMSKNYSLGDSTDISDTQELSGYKIFLGNSSVIFCFFPHCLSSRCFVSFRTKIFRKSNLYLLFSFLLILFTCPPVS